MKERIMKTANIRRWKTIFLALMIVFAASVTVFATSVTALAAGAEVTWVKVKLTNKCQAHWNFVRSEDARKQDVDHYEVRVYVEDIDEPGSDDWELWDTIATEDRTRHEKLAVTEAGSYMFKVRAVMNDGTVTAWSPESNVVTISAEKAKKLNRKQNKASTRKAAKDDDDKRVRKDKKNKKNKQNKPAKDSSSRSSSADKRARKHVTNADGSLKRGWELVDGVWKYYDKNGDEAVGWLFVKGHWYYLDEDGEMMTGWIRNNGKEYYLDENGAMATGKASVDGREHDFDASGAKTDTVAVDEIEIEDTEVTDVTVETEAAAQ